MKLQTTYSRLVEIGIAAAVLVFVAAFVSAGGGRQAPKVIVYKGPTCMCCTVWTQQLTEHGFEVEVDESRDLAAVMSENGVPAELTSCHIALVDRYIVVGHVPVAEIERLLKERPDIAGIAVPGTAAESDYDVLAFDRAGKVWVYTSY
jgi:hypothetical protein